MKRGIWLALLLVVPTGLSLGYAQAWWQDYQPWNDRGEVTVFHMSCDRPRISVKYELKVDAGGREQWKVIRPDEGLQGRSAPEAFADREIVFILDLDYMQPQSDGSVSDESLAGEAACIRITAAAEPAMYVRISLEASRHIQLVVTEKGVSLDEGDRGFLGAVTWRRRPWMAAISLESCESLRAQ